MLFIASSGKSHLVNLDTKTVERTYATTPVERRGVVYCPALRVVISNQLRGCASFLSPVMQQPVLRCFTPEVVTAATSAGNGAYLLAGTAEGSVYVWVVLTGQLLRLVRSHTRRVNEIAVSGDESLIATASEDSVCKTWTLAALAARGASAATPRAVFNGHSLSVNTCCFLESSHSVVTGSSDRSCRVFDALTGQQQLVVTVDEPLAAVRPCPGDELLVLGSITGSLFFVRLYSPSEDLCLPTAGLSKRDDGVVTRRAFVDGHGGAIVFMGCDYTRADHVLVGSANGVVLWWNYRTATPVGYAVDKVAGGLLSACYVPLDALWFSTRLSACTGLQKHPLDPLGMDFLVVSAATKEPAAPACLREGGGRASRRKRRRQQMDNVVGATAGCAATPVGGAHAEANLQVTALQSSAVALAALRQSNDELECLRDKLKEKLRRLTTESRA